jgi:hypothetical protein
MQEKEQATKPEVYAFIVPDMLKIQKLFLWD